MPKTRWVLAVLAALLATPCPALAQGGPRALVGPGDVVAAGLLSAEGGALGRELSQHLGKRPVLGVYWRPKDALSEQALVNAAAIAESVAPHAAFYPVAVLAAAQPPADIAERLAALGLRHLPAREDAGGRLAQALGVRALPSFFLVDAGAVLRLVGGADITQAGPTGLSIVEALALAGKGAPVPTLGTLPSETIYSLLGQRLPDLAATELDGATYRKLSQYLAGGKKMLLFYWSPHCPHCREELPKLTAWYGREKPQDLVLVDVARGDAPTLRSEAAQLIRDAPGVHLLDVDRSIGKALLVRETPTTFLISSDGEILSIRPGSGIDWEGWLEGATRARSASAR